jgi:hypothetical protein
MFRKMVFFGLACALAGLVACAGPLGKGQGESCSSFDDCAADLTCQPIGSHGDFCCPTPASASTSSNCKASPDGG